MARSSRAVTVRPPSLRQPACFASWPVAEPGAAQPRAAVPARLALALIIAVVRGLGPLRRPVAGLIGAAWYASLPAEARRRVARNHRRLHPALRERTSEALARASFKEYVAMILDSIWA